MSKPAETYSQLPDASAFTGKKIRAESALVSANTVLSHEFPCVPQARILGQYALALAQQTVLASAQDGISSGFLWMHMPIAVSGRVARVRRITYTPQLSSALITATAPRLRLDRFTFTGTATGATAVGCKTTFGEQFPMLDLRTAVTGLTVTLVGAASTGAIGGALTAVSAVNVSPIISADNDLIALDVEEDAWLAINPGEGFVLWQDTAGTSSDTRKLNVSVFWDEVDAS